MRLAMLFGSLIAMMLVPSQAFAQRVPPSEWKWVDKNIAESCQHATLFSKSMQREIGYSIFLPPSYKESGDRRYPVVYYLHGASGSESSSREFAWAVQKAIAEGAIEETIYVFPNGGHYSGYRDWDDESVLAETWIIRELIPHIDATYRTLDDRSKRALCGWSMGGGGSLRFLTKYPEMFCAAATMSAAVQMRGGDPADSASAHAKKNAELLRGRVGIWMAVGEDDRLKDGNEAFSKTLDDLDIVHTLTILPDTGHNLGQMSAKFHRDIVLMLDQNLNGSKAPGNSSNANVDSVKLIYDEPYKSGEGLSDYEQERCKLDWYLPTDRKGFPTLVWFHGGGLRNGHKGDDIAVSVANRFASEGIAVASINYRLSPKVSYPAYTEDAAAAVAYVRRSVEKHGGEPDLIFVSGHSAGGYLAAMVGLHPQLLADRGLKRSDIAGFIPVAGQMVTHSTVRAERGVARTQPIIDDAAPAYHVTPLASPFLCFAGDQDLPARSEENRYFAAVMKNAGHDSTRFIEVADRDHGTVASEMGQPDDLVASEILNFIGEISAAK
ncbi:alpha/beta hydrolase fold domain-containing protein [Stieleria sp. JC731]|uniref:alpha/beta hydrolase n=1 Tax=Pirellulaceae TaxID=2691357 RepID=UPI001E4CA15C|nr:alpha/beta hydrolase-fold protein [Stieleria sp. JC731]MCC9601184.1 alpha/beta hydrolase fold domain-containing protein [Stieleria sp. JC731]